ncbi:tetratricopeptide repeat protein [Thalassomonas viridans]|uniref:Tetratricopeptide repeat protein n=1 Tax=Thalassomonas viridans TaxID=137584 RepID=A0AAF0C9R2_9GAMM|nr:tetratricopeptide repeat protein [Thalassomonas viridans]WDE05520.1 tetratricopeptide repeat protein [Thalassomonas viridans]
MKLCSLIIFFSLTSLIASARQQAPEYQAIEENITRVEDYYLRQDETLPYEAVVALSSQVVQNRQYYSSNTLAKVFALLADAADSKGDVAGAVQFARDGLTINIIEPWLRLDLLLKLVKGYFTGGNFQRVFETAGEMMALADGTQAKQYRLMALAYRAMSNALLNYSEQALSDLHQVEQLLARHQELARSLELLQLLAQTRFYLHDYQSALSMQQAILQMRFDLGRKKNIEQTYLQLAQAYRYNGKLDDAYHAYWEAKTFAEEKSAPILIGYAQLGLGQVLFAQGAYGEAEQALLAAQTLFQEENLKSPFLTTLITLAQTRQKTRGTASAYPYLLQAEKLSENMELTREHIELYPLLSAMYRTQQDIPRALHALLTYTELHERFVLNQNRPAPDGGPALLTSEKSKQLAAKLIEKNALHASFSEKYQVQQKIIVVLAVLVIFLLLFLLAGWLKYRAKKLNLAYDEVEQASDVLASPAKIKQIYQLAYKMARKYEYPLTVGYLSINNWKELSFRFNKKILMEVTKTVATLVNEYSGEFDRAGMLDEGEYLLLCPHQSGHEVEEKLRKLTESIKVRFFANLGEFSVNITFSYDVPSVQDIDPYMFLAKLTEATGDKSFS